MLLKIFLLLGMTTSYGLSSQIEQFGRVSVDAREFNNKDYVIFDTLHSLYYLEGVLSPQNTNYTHDYITVGGEKIYDGDFVRVIGEIGEGPEKGSLAGIYNVTDIKVVYQNPRIECVSPLAKNGSYYYLTVSPHNEYIGRTGGIYYGFVRVDKCHVGNSVDVCSDTWSGVDFDYEKIDYKENEKINISGVPGASYYMRENTEGAYLLEKKYDEQKYSENILKSRKFDFNFQTDVALKDLPQQRPYGYIGIDKFMENKEMKEKPNAKVKWRYDFGSLFIEDDFSLYCYTWN